MQPEDTFTLEILQDLGLEDSVPPWYAPLKSKRARFSRLIILVLLLLESHTIPERFSRTLLPPDMKQAYALDLVLLLSINSKDRCLQV